MANDRLFEMLAQAKAQPDRWARALGTGVNSADDILQGYLQGKQIQMQMNQPAAMARLLNASGPQGQSIVDTMGPQGAASALYGAKPEDVLNYAGKQAQLAQTGALGYAGINERNAASQRQADAANARTKSQESIFGGKNLSSNIALHENEVQRLNAQNDSLASKLPSGVSGMLKQWLTTGGMIPQALQDPQFSSIANQMKANQSRINFHQQALQPLYRAQGMIPPSILDNSDIGNINPQTSGTGDSSIVSGLPGFGQ